MPNRFLASGAYGCVYYPGYDCNGQPVDKTENITKLVLNNFSTQTEIVVGEILKRVPLYNRYFLIVHKHCDISKNRLKGMTKGCKIFEKEHDKHYILLYSKYVKSIQLCDYMLETKLINKFMRVYFLLTERLNILTENRIVHNDLHFGNVLYSTETSNLYIIDYGLSLIVDRFYSNGKLDMDYLKNGIFKFSPDWVWWSLDYHFLCYLIHGGKMSIDLIKNTVDYYLKDEIFKLFDKEYILNYRNESIKIFEKLLDMSTEKAISYLLTFWNTWDYYKIAMHIIEYIKDDIPELRKSLLLSVDPNPEKRPTVLEHRILNKKVLLKHTLKYTSKNYEADIKRLNLTKSVK